MASQDTLVVGTAGHIDHGKTTLVKALTGVDLDTLPEEKERGITIALGFAPLVLANGDVVGLVDVPGHERLVRTMVAGASGLDAVMLCVSAVEGVMPQTREHLDILGFLGVRSGVLVVTMGDLVDPELLELATEEIRDQVSGTFLDGAETVVVSAVTGAGLPRLKELLAGLPRRDRALGGPFRLPVDRSFARKGFGTVVTGTAWSGSIADGSEVEIAPGGRRARLRGVQVHGAKVDAARAGSRTALNLSGVDVADVPRGSWLTTPGAVRPTQVVDVAVRWVAGQEPEDDEDRAVILLHGTAEIAARLVQLDPGPEQAAGKERLAQLRLSEPLACLPGDRFVLRMASPSRTLGGGTVLDPWFAVARRARAIEGVPALRALASNQPGAWLQRAGTHGVDKALAERLGCKGVALAERTYAPDVVAGLRAALLATLKELHAQHPLAAWLNRKEAHRGTLKELDDKGFLAVLELEIAVGTVVVTPTGVRLAEWAVHLDPGQAAFTEQVLRLAGKAAWEGLAELPEHPDAVALLHVLKDRGLVERVGERWYDRAALAQLADAVRAFFSAHAAMDPAAFKEITAQSRRTAIPLLEWLDQSGVTERSGDVRVLRASKAPPV